MLNGKEKERRERCEGQKEQKQVLNFKMRNCSNDRQFMPPPKGDDDDCL